jgi:thioredoxin 1
MGEKTFEVTSGNFQSDVLGADKPVLVDFWAEWCGPCKRIAPIVEEIANEYDSQLRVGKLDADAHGDIVSNLGIMSIPTLILFKGGNDVVRIIGYKTKDKILKDLTPHLG